MVPTARPTGASEIKAAVLAAAIELLATRGSSFTVREVAAAADVNHGLVHRHFGSKEALITAAAAEINARLVRQLESGVSLGRLLLTETPQTSSTLAHLIIDRADQLVRDHPASEAIVEQARRAGGANASAESRAALAVATGLGWAMFGAFLTDATGADPDEVSQLAEHLVDDLVSGALLLPRSDEVLGRPPR